MRATKHISIAFVACWALCLSFSYHLLLVAPTGSEEVPEGAVVVLTSGDCPDVLSHSAVRARNMGVLMAACLSDEVRRETRSAKS